MQTTVQLTRAYVGSLLNVRPPTARTTAAKYHIRMFWSYIKWRPYSGGQFLIAEHPVLESLRPLLLRLEDAAVEIRLADERHLVAFATFTILVNRICDDLTCNEVVTVQPRFNLVRNTNPQCLTHVEINQLFCRLRFICYFFLVESIEWIVPRMRTGDIRHCAIALQRMIMRTLLPFFLWVIGTGTLLVLLYVANQWYISSWFIDSKNVIVILSRCHRNRFLGG